MSDFSTKTISLLGAPTPATQSSVTRKRHAQPQNKCPASIKNTEQDKVAAFNHPVQFQTRQFVTAALFWLYSKKPTLAYRPYPGTYKDVRHDGTTLTLLIAPQGQHYRMAGSLSHRSNPCFQNQKIDGIFDPTSGSYIETFLGIGHVDSATASGYFLRERAGFAIKVGSEYFLPLLKTFTWRECEVASQKICGVWYGQLGHIRARWNNGAIARLQFENKGSDVRITRSDPGGASIGLQAIYRGTRQGDVINGDVRWIWPDGHTTYGSWSAQLKGVYK